MPDEDIRLPLHEGMTEVKFRGRAAGDVVCRGGQYMIRVSTAVTASFCTDGASRNVTGIMSVPVDRWTHLAITWDQGTKRAGTFLESAGITPPADMDARSLLPLARGETQPHRDAVFVERERHANVRQGDLSYPVRGIRTREFLYLRNVNPDRWPVGDPEYYHARKKNRLTLPVPGLRTP